MSGPRPVVHRVGSVTAWGLTLSAGVGVAVVTAIGASTASASTVSGLPLPSPSLAVSSLPAISVSSVSVPALPLPSVSVTSVPALPLPSTSAPVVTVPSLPVPVSTTPLPSVSSVSGLPSAPAPVGSVVSGVQSGVQSGVSQIGGSLSGISGVTGGTTGSLLNLGVNASPIATACVQAKGTGTAIANVTVTVGGYNLTAPLVQALPGVLAPCPSGATPGTPGVGASAGGGLVGACVQATAKAPLDASILVLDSELISTLTTAGVPLQQLVVPCPKGLTGQPGSVGADSGNPAGAAAGLGAGGSLAGSAAARGTGQGGSAANCANGSGGWFSLNAQTLSSVIPRNLPQTLPWVLLTLALLGRRRLASAVASVRAFRGFGRFRLPAEVGTASAQR